MGDPKGAQIVYEVSPVIRAASLERDPRIRPTLAAVFQGLDAATLRGLNAAVSVEGEPPDSVAEHYLRRRGLIG